MCTNLVVTLSHSFILEYKKHFLVVWRKLCFSKRGETCLMSHAILKIRSYLNLMLFFERSLTFSDLRKMSKGIWSLILNYNENTSWTKLLQKFWLTFEILIKLLEAKKKVFIIYRDIKKQCYKIKVAMTPTYITKAFKFWVNTTITCYVLHNQLFAVILAKLDVTKYTTNF